MVGVDICANISSISYPLATPQDLATTGQYVQYVGSNVSATVLDIALGSNVRYTA